MKLYEIVYPVNFLIYAESVDDAKEKVERIIETMQYETLSDEEQMHYECDYAEEVQE